MNKSYVLDSFAVLAFLNKEPGGARVKALFQAAAAGEVELVISLINLGEVLYRVARQRGQSEASATLALLDDSPLTYLTVTRERVVAASRLKAAYSMSYADAFAAAAAQELDAVVVTGDPDFHHVEDRITVEWLPRRSQ